MDRCFLIFTALSIFSIGNMTSLFLESGTHPPARAAFAISRCESRRPQGARRSMSVVTPLSPAAFPLTTYIQWSDHSVRVIAMISPAAVVTTPV